MRRNRWRRRGRAQSAEGGRPRRHAPLTSIVERAVATWRSVACGARIARALRRRPRATRGARRREHVRRGPPLRWRQQLAAAAERRRARLRRLEYSVPAGRHGLRDASAVSASALRALESPWRQCVGGVGSRRAAHASASTARRRRRSSRAPRRRPVCTRRSRSSAARACSNGVGVAPAAGANDAIAAAARSSSEHRLIVAGTRTSATALSSRQCALSAAIRTCGAGVDERQPREALPRQPKRRLRPGCQRRSSAPTDRRSSSASSSAAVDGGVLDQSQRVRRSGPVARRLAHAVPRAAPRHRASSKTAAARWPRDARPRSRIGQRCDDASPQSSNAK